ncbi:hypothetical protein [Polyangium sp. y55x31]|uniref:hypothetical protein n=1 Tax=Polyangium sp. y55x31 TaxID=3042688 RepID=UPI002482742A|nr:hypothetical protein [Polyangium sp. y55x31]MDI1480874.1 hypothetical protein [Polyangium sp. y55x31]
MGKRMGGTMLACMIGAMCCFAGASARAEERGAPRSEAREGTSEARGTLVAEPTMCARCMRGCLRGDYRWWPFNCETLCAVLLCRPEHRVGADDEVTTRSIQP